MRFTNTQNYPITIFWKPLMSRELIRSSDPESFTVYPGITKQLSLSFWLFGQFLMSTPGDVISWTATANQQAMLLNGKEERRSSTDDLQTTSDGEYNSIELTAPKGLYHHYFMNQMIWYR